MMSHEESDGSNRLVTVMHMWNLHHLTRSPKSLVVVGQRRHVILGRKVAIVLLKDEILGVGQHSVEGCRGRQCHRVPGTAERGRMGVVLCEDYTTSGKRPITLSSLPTMRKQSAGGLIEGYWIGTERIDVAAA